ncbi:uncharacterized protein LOC134219869 [Armigeres subalbatus]|uniref:uncharacterized protein LOC134219869 n=1 Tax=Armigeres subalbatus TaxID=124917 RepID=UPI002ED0E7D6
MDYLSEQPSLSSDSSPNSSLESPPFLISGSSHGSLSTDSEQSIQLMIEELDQMCYLPDLVQEQRAVLTNPFNVCKILRSHPNARAKLVVYFLRLEQSTKDFVWTLVENICSFIRRRTDLSDGHLLGFHSMLKLGTFLMDAGWQAEAIILLNIASGQAKGQTIKLLTVLKTLLLAESLSNREEAAFSTLSQIHTLAGMAESIPMALTVELHNSFAVSFFEKLDFNSSYQQGLLALQLLGEGTHRNEVKIGVFRQLSKSCLAKGRPVQAKLLITQAVSWALHCFGSSSVIYAEVLEDYAFYLLMMNAYEDAVSATNEAKNIYYKQYGPLALQAELAQGNLAFRMYIDNQKFYDMVNVDQYIEYIGGTNDKRRQLAITGSDDRQMLAVKRMRTMMVIRKLYQYGSTTTPNDRIENVQTQRTVNEIKNMFFQ